MSKRNIAWLVVVLAGVLAAAGLLFAIGGTTRLVFTEPEIQTRLNQQLPRTVREVTIERVAVRLAENRLALRIEISGTAMRQAVSATVSARGLPRYEQESAEVYFDADEVEVEQLTVAGRTVVGEPDGRGRRRVANAVGSAVQRVAEAAIKAYLAARPVYRFKDDFKGIVLKAALSGIAIEGNTLVVTVSLWSLTATAAAYAVALLAVRLIVLWLVRHPGWGAADLGT
jgi:Protein of unknown function (DUF1439)